MAETENHQAEEPAHGPACACLRVVHVRIDHHDNSCSERWECNLCGTRFARVLKSNPPASEPPIVEHLREIVAAHSSTGEAGAFSLSVRNLSLLEARQLMAWGGRVESASDLTTELGRLKRELAAVLKGEEAEREELAALKAQIESDRADYDENRKRLYRQAVDADAELAALKAAVGKAIVLAQRVLEKDAILRASTLPVLHAHEALEAILESLQANPPGYTDGTHGSIPKVGPREESSPMPSPSPTTLAELATVLAWLGATGYEPDQSEGARAVAQAHVGGERWLVDRNWFIGMRAPVGHGEVAVDCRGVRAELEREPIFRPEPRSTQPGESGGRPSEERCKACGSTNIDRGDFGYRMNGGGRWS